MHAIESTIELLGGTQIPRLGLGVFEAGAGQGTENAVGWALQAGYRHIDTAKVYGNEVEVGNAIRSSGVNRDEVFVTSKVINEDQGYEATLSACNASLDRLQLDYLNLYLIHWPEAGKEIATWRALIELRDQGRCRAIGVSNFAISRMQLLIDATDVVPEVNQVEFHPFMYRSRLLNWCKELGIVLEAYCPLARGYGFDHATVQAIAARHDKSPAQVYLRWSLQRDVVVIPKSSHRDRIAQNAEIFDFALTDEDMTALDALNTFHTVAWLPPDWPDSIELDN